MESPSRVKRKADRVVGYFGSAPGVRRLFYQPYAPDPEFADLCFQIVPNHKMIQSTRHPKIALSVSCELQAL